MLKWNKRAYRNSSGRWELRTVIGIVFCSLSETIITKKSTRELEFILLFKSRLLDGIIYEKGDTRYGNNAVKVFIVSGKAKRTQPPVRLSIY